MSSILWYLHIFKGILYLVVFYGTTVYLTTNTLTGTWVASSSWIDNKAATDICIQDLCEHKSLFQGKCPRGDHWVIAQLNV